MTDRMLRAAQTQNTHQARQTPISRLAALLGTDTSTALLRLRLACSPPLHWPIVSRNSSRLNTAAAVGTGGGGGRTVTLIKNEAGERHGADCIRRDRGVEEVARVARCASIASCERPVRAPQFELGASPTTQHQNHNTSSNDMKDTTGLTNCCLSVQWALPLPTHREDAGQRTSTQMKNSPICLQLKSRKYWTRHSKVEMARATGHAADMDICHEHQLDQMTILKSVQQ